MAQNKRLDFSKRIDGRYNIWKLGPDPMSELAEDIVECWRWILIDVVDTRSEAVARVRGDGEPKN